MPYRGYGFFIFPVLIFIYFNKITGFLFLYHTILALKMNFFILKKVAFVIRIGFNWIAIKFTTVKLKLYNLCR